MFIFRFRPSMVTFFIVPGIVCPQRCCPPPSWVQKPDEAPNKLIASGVQEISNKGS